MSYKDGRQRNQSLFQKGMTLQDYVRGMELREANIPTADTYDNVADQVQQCLYKTTHNFYNPPSKPNVSSIKEIEEQSYQESMQQYRESTNIGSSNLKKMGKQSLVVVEQYQKKYRIRNGRSVSPYIQNKGKKDESIKKAYDNRQLKTFTNKFYKDQPLLDQFILQNQNIQHQHQSPVLFFKKEENTGSKKRLPDNVGFDCENKSKKMGMMNYTLSNKWHQAGKISDNKGNKFKNALEKVDLRIESFKGRLEQKKKDRKNNQ